MRIDKLLKALCLVKTRNQGRKGCEAGCIRINGRTAKPAREVRVGDILEIRYPNRILAVEVLELPGGQIARSEKDRFIRVIRESALRGEGGLWDG